MSTAIPARDTDIAVLDAVQRRVLWLATSIVHHANRVRRTPSGVKVGGHQASSASMVSVMTALYFHHLRAPDRVSVKPHAAPVLHAIEYLLGQLDRHHLTELRAFGGLQSYPSRLKDPVPADFSTGSVGIGATAPIWSALAHRYVAGHFDVPQGGRQVSLVGDAELDEGAVWEAIVDPVVTHLGEVLWIVDLNRQSLDRVVPDIAAGRLAAMFEAAGWHVNTVKYGRRLSAHPALCDRITEMPNEEYQRLLRATDVADLRGRLGDAAADIGDGDLREIVRDLGGHDLGLLLEAFDAADAVTDRPSVIFAYTIKAWRLQTEGHPGNHSALLTVDQWEQLAAALGADAADPWAAFEPGTAEAELCTEVAARLRRPAVELRPVPAIPDDLGAQLGLGRAVHRGRRAAAPAGGRAAPGPGDPGRPRPPAHRQGVDPAGVRALLRGPLARRLRRRRAGRDREP